MDRILCLIIYILTILGGSAKNLAALGIGTYEEWKPGSRRRILLAGYNGARNTGSDARVAAIAKQLKQLYGPDEIEITVMTLDKDSLKGYFDRDVRLTEFTTIFPTALYRACCSHHAVILCEGSTLKSTFANGLTLFLCEAAGVMAAQHKPAIAYGAEVGTMEPFLEKAAIKLCRKAYFITRTEDSRKKLLSLGLTGHTGTDTAWRYDGAISPDKAGDLLVKAGWDGRKPILGIAPIDPFCWPVRASLFRWIRTVLTKDAEDQYDKWYYYSTSPERKQAFRRYINGIASAVRRFQKDQDVFIILLGMEKMDAKACSALEQQLGGRYPKFLSESCSADIMAGILQKLSLLVTSRYHAAVLSMKDPCPVTAVSMDERLDSLMGEILPDGPYLLHTQDTDLADSIYRSLTEGFEKREMIIDRLQVLQESYESEFDDMGIFLRNYLDEKLEKKAYKNA